MPATASPAATVPARTRVGLLALTLEFYETLAPALRPGREAWVREALIPALGPDCDVLFEGAAYRREAIERTVAGFEAAGVDALLVVLPTYAPSQLALPALQRTRLPILIWNTQEQHATDASFTLDAMIENHGVHGTQDLASVLVRTGVKFHYVTSHVADPDGSAEVRDFIAAAAAVRRLRGATIGRLGHPFPGMGDFAVDTTHLAATLGCGWVNLSLDEYHRLAAEAADGEVGQLVDNYRASYAVASDVTPADLAATARSELAWRRFVVDRGLAAITYQFLAFGEDARTETLPFVAASRLMADGIGFGGEGDLVGAAGTLLLNALMPPATFSEIFTIDFAGNSVFMSHMGEANVAMARPDRPIPLVARPTPIVPTRARQLALITNPTPGPATFAALAQGPGGRWRIIAAPVRITDTPPRPGFYVPHFNLAPDGDVRTFLSRYAQAGGPHHNAVCFGDARRRLRFAAEMLGADYVAL